MKKNLFIFLIASLCSITVINGQTVLRVNSTATTTPADGLTWESAYTTLDEAITAANAVGNPDTERDSGKNIVEIWVKAGTYLPTTYADGFFMRQYINVYGGFAGTETSKEQRDWHANVTILNPSGAGKPVIQKYSSNASMIRTAEWDGFTITGVTGNAGSGGAVQLQRGCTLRNCLITENTVAGTGNGTIFMYPGATLENCTISNNTIQGSGCGISVGHWTGVNPGDQDDPAKIINCVVINNESKTGSAAVSISAPYSAGIYNTLVANNSAGGAVGGIAAGSSSGLTKTNLINCTIVNNVGSNDSQAGVSIMSNVAGSSNITNCIVYGNKGGDGTAVSNLYINNPDNILVTYTAVEDSLFIGAGNISLPDNQFVNPTVNAGKQALLPEYDWNLAITSICVNAGNNAVAFGSSDLAGNYRVNQGSIDIGAYEFYDMTATWKGTEALSDTDWSNPVNWDGQSMPSCTGTTDVTIASTATYYPTLTNTAKVSSITFAPGAELGGQNYLAVTQDGGATVQFNFTESSRRHMLSLPVSDVNAAVFDFPNPGTDNPYAWLEKFEPQGGKAKWTFKDKTASLGIGEGFIVSIGNFDNDNNPIGWSGGKSVSFTGNLWKDGENTTFESSADLDFGTANSSSFALVGNPFMTSIDFAKLQANNFGLIKPNYQVWAEATPGTEGFAQIIFDDNGDFVDRTGVTSSTGDLDKYIAPLQSFFVERNGTVTGKLRFDLTTDGEKEAIVATGNGKLRSAASDSYGKLDIIADNGTVPVKTFVTNRENMQSARKLLNGCGSIPDVYTLSSDKVTAYGAQAVTSNDVAIPLAIATSYSGSMSLTFSGMSGYAGTTISLYDDVTKATIPLTGDSYRHDFEYIAPSQSDSITAEESRFVLVFSPSNATDTSGSTTSGLSVYAENGSVYAVSTAVDCIKEIELYDMQGRMLYATGSLNIPTCTFDAPETTGVYIVKVRTENGIKTVKLTTK